MTKPVKILLQTTIFGTTDDWHIERFSLLADHLRSVQDDDGTPMFEVTARDRSPLGAPDPMFSTLDTLGFDELWLFAVDTGDGLQAEDLAGIARFYAAGGGLLVTRDHMDLGCSVCSLGPVGAAHIFHSHNVEPDAIVPAPDDRATPEILWPNFHSGANGDFQPIDIAIPLHPVLRDHEARDGAIRVMPSHPHEGAVAVPAGEPAARVIATGVSRATGSRFNIAVAFEATAVRGPGLAQSTFHHFADYNWDPARGTPAFVSEPPGDGLRTTPWAMKSIHRYVENLALWLAGRLPV